MSQTEKQRQLERIAALMREMPTNVSNTSLEHWPEYELTMGQFKALTLLHAGPMRMGDLSSSLNVGLSSISNLVDRLESKGLVRRVHALHDRRVVTCELTETGKKTVVTLWQVGRDGLLQVLDFLHEPELNTVAEAFELIITASNRARDELERGDQSR